MSEQPVTVAFLQNQWFKNPDKIRGMYEGHAAKIGLYPARARLNELFLFYRSLTGRRLKAAFGDEACRQIVWEEASAVVGGVSSSAYPADPTHMIAVIQHHQPSVVLTFGKIANDGINAVMQLVHRDRLACPKFMILCAPHPAARHASVPFELKATAFAWRTWVDKNFVASMPVR